MALSRAEIQRRYKARHPERVKARNAQWRRDNPEKVKGYMRKWLLKKGYGLTLEQYERLLEDQNGVCAICLQPEHRVYNGTLASLAVDHCHETGRVRGLLCIRCNRSLHDTVWHNAALSYLDETRLVKVASTLEGDDVPKGSH